MQFVKEINRGHKYGPINHWAAGELGVKERGREPAVQLRVTREQVQKTASHVC